MINIVILISILFLIGKYLGSSAMNPMIFKQLSQWESNKLNWLIRHSNSQTHLILIWRSIFDQRSI